MDLSEWVALGAEEIVTLLKTEYAVTRHEIEAKLAERAQRAVQPHVLTYSLRELLNHGFIEENVTPTRGGRSITIYHLSDMRLIKRKIADAAGRKRLLQTRFNGWATGEGKSDFAGTIGKAGEAVLQMSMKAAATNPGVPAAVAQPDVRVPRVTDMFGIEVPIGPLDNAMVRVDNGKVIYLPVEMKNRRGWLYSDANEVYQLLAKAAHMQAQHPHLLICPVLVCRRGQYTLFAMMRSVGGYAIQTKEQYVLADIDTRLVQEVRNELGYDLVQAVQPPALLTSQFVKSLPRQAPVQAEKWRSLAPQLLPYLDGLRVANGTQRRRAAFESLLRAAEALGVKDTKFWRTSTIASD